MFDGNMTLELYDLDKDLREANDLADSHPSIVNKIEAIMTKEHLPSKIEKFKFSILGDK